MVVGDSAGGNMAAAVTLLAKRRGTPTRGALIQITDTLRGVLGGPGGRAGA
jgi:acetyl esterase/lipase